MKTVNVSLVGVGGQGIILTADLLAKTAAIAGYDVKKSEIHGMAQRGGSVTSQVRFGKEVASPIIQEGTADILVSFDKLEAIRNVGILARAGTALVNDLYLVPVTVSSGLQQPVTDFETRLSKAFPDALVVDAQKIAEEVGNPKGANVAILGSLMEKCNIVSEEKMAEAIRIELGERKAKFLEGNMKAYRAGMEAAK